MQYRIFDDQLDPSRPLLAGEARLTTAELLQASARVRGWLTAAGLHPGDRFAVMLCDSVEVTVALAAALGGGFSLVVFDPGTGPAELQRALLGAEVKLVILDAEQIARSGLEHPRDGLAVYRAQPRTPPKLVSRLLGRAAPPDPTAYPACTDSARPQPPRKQVDGSEEALVLSTSGTSDRPKLASISHANLQAQAETMARLFGYGADARVLNMAPLSHVDGITGVYVALYTGTTLVRPGPFSIPRVPAVLDCIYRERVTHALLNPTLLRLFLQFGDHLRGDFENDDMRLVISTAAPLTPELWREFEQATGVALVNMYGMTEVGNVLFAGPDPATRGIGTVGVPVDCEIELRDDRGQTIAGDGPGELCVKGPSVFSGYLGEAPAGEWFATGDLAQRDADGHYRIVGRKKSVIIVGGRNVHADEVSHALETHPHVTAAATLGLQDATFGERVISCVTVDDGSLDRAELMSHVAALLADYKIPRAVHIVAELPRGRSGKVELAALRTQVGQLEQHGVTAGETIAERVMALAAEAFRTPRNQLDLQTSPTRCRGWDSLAHLDFVMRLEKAFGVAFTPEDIMGLESLGAAIQTVSAKRGEAP